MKIVKADAKSVNLALQYLKSGKAVVYPTDTAYGLGVDATNVAAVKRLYKIKGRSFRKPMHVIVSGFQMAKKYAKFDKTAERMFKKFMPGPLTLILDFRFKILDLGMKLLSAGTETIGVRMPDNRIALSLVKKLGKPITTTSANLAGGQTPYSVEESLKQFRNKKYQPDLYLDAGELPKVQPSTMVRVENGKIEILRQGPVKKKQILSVIASDRRERGNLKK